MMCLNGLSKDALRCDAKNGVRTVMDEFSSLLISRSPWKGKCKERVLDAGLRCTFPRLQLSQYGDTLLKSVLHYYMNDQGYPLNFVGGYLACGAFVVRVLGDFFFACASQKGIFNKQMAFYTLWNGRWWLCLLPNIVARAFLFVEIAFATID